MNKRYIQKEREGFFATFKGSKEYLSNDISLLEFTPLLNTVLYEKQVKNIADFIALDMDTITNTPGVGARKLAKLREVQRKLRQVYPSWEKNHDIISLQSKKNKLLVDSVRIQRYKVIPTIFSDSCLSKPVRFFFDIETDKQRISTLGLSKTTISHLQCIHIYEFDPISFLFDFSIEYYCVMLEKYTLVDIFSAIYRLYPLKTQVKLKLDFPLKVLPDILNLSIPASILNPGEAVTLRDNEIFSFKDWYDSCAIHYVFSVDNINIVFTLLKTYSKISNFLLTSENIINSHKSIIELMELNSNQRDISIFLDRICGQMTLENISSRHLITPERVRQICMVRSEER
ncbi:MAG: hypothetical protein PHE87_06520, partial [Victivallaceae bacterium]|nr:hypothetical protein [Victivallaceae bacterium]